MIANKKKQEKTKMQSIESTFLIIGGGISGVSCVETLTFLCPNESITLISESSLIKTVTNLVPLGKAITRFDIVEQEAYTLKGNLRVLTDRLIEINSANKTATTSSGIHVKYKFMCLCTGARPKLIKIANNNPHVIGIRDTESVLDFQKRIKNSKRIVIVGNGGIASEIVYETRNVTIDWVIKDSFISQTFVDPGAAELFKAKLQKKSTEERSVKTTFKRMRYTEEDGVKSLNGGALGPDWHRTLNFDGNECNISNSVNVHTKCEVDSIATTNDGLQVTLTNGTSIVCDFLISATGVSPSYDFTTHSISISQ